MVSASGQTPPGGTRNLGVGGEYLSSSDWIGRLARSASPHPCRARCVHRMARKRTDQSCMGCLVNGAAMGCVYYGDVPRTSEGGPCYIDAQRDSESHREDRARRKRLSRDRAASIEQYSRARPVEVAGWTVRELGNVAATHLAESVQSIRTQSGRGAADYRWSGWIRI